MSDERKRQEIIKEAERKMKLKLIEERMKSLIKSSVDMDVQLESGKTWGFNPKEKKITYCLTGEHNIFNLTENEVIGMILHEIAHANFTEQFTPVSIPEPRADYATFLNTCDDIRVEKKLMDKYPGTYDSFRKIAKSVQDQLEEEFIQMVPAHINYLLNLRQHQWNFKLYFKNKHVEDMFLDTLLLVKGVSKFETITEMNSYLMTEVWPKFKTLIEDMANDENAPPSSYSHQIGKPQPQSKPEEQEQQNENENEDSGGGSGTSPQEEQEQEQQEQQEQKSGSGDSDDTHDDQQGNQDQGQQNDDKKPQTKAQKKRDEEYKQNVKNQLKTAFTKKVMEMKELVDTVKQFSRNIEKNRGKTLEQEVDEEIERQKKLDQTEQKTAKPEMRISNTSDFKTYEELYADVAVYIPYFKLKLQSIMEDNKMRRYGGAFTRGKLNNKLLYKWKCKSTRVFSQKIRRMHKEYAVTLLIDESNSMTHRNRHLNAARSAVLLSEVLHAVGVPFEIRGFNASERIYKKFSQPFNWVVKRNLENIIPSANEGDSSNTNDAFAINWATDSLMREPGEKMLIVLCDGEPNPNYRQIPTKDKLRLKGLFSNYSDFDLDIEVMKAKRHVLVMGVGIESTEVTEHYTDNVVCNEISELPLLILNLIKKYIRRG